MAEITEYLYRGQLYFSNDRWDWLLQDDAAVSGTFATTTFVPTRVVLTLRNEATGKVVVMDTNTATYSFSGVGGPANFSFDSGALTIDLGDIPIATVRPGTYAARLAVFDGTDTAGHRWGRQDITVLCEDL